MLVALGFVLVSVNNVLALNSVRLLDADGNVLNVEFRWLIEEDKTYHVQLNPGGTVLTEPDGGGGEVPVVDPNWDQGKTLALSFHQSYMPVVATGSSALAQAELAAVALDPTKEYFISILPETGYALGGAQFSGDQTTADVYLTPYPIPTTQIVIFVHEDMLPINNAWDVGEGGLEGFQIVLEDAGGKYGASAGIQSVDVYGNPLCTLYETDAFGDYIPDPDTVYQISATTPTGCTTDVDGRLTIKNIAPGKYGVIAVAPQGSNWIQTSTIEGTILIDAWVKANEPAFFGEFGPPGPHVSIGFVPAAEGVPYVDAAVLTGGMTLEGQVVNMHLSRPPDATFHLGGPFPHTTPWVGLNAMAGGVLGQGLYANRTTDGAFTIPDVPPGDYQLVIWDDNLDLLFAGSTVTVDAAGCNGQVGCDLGNIGVFQWFHRMEHMVYYDANDNNIRNDTDPGLLEQGVVLRWRDGTIYQEFPTDADGFAPFDEVFPFFAWLVAEVDFARFKATGVTSIVDDGGAIDFGSWLNFGDQLAPQSQRFPAEAAPIVTTRRYRYEPGPVLSMAFQGFLGQTNVVQWKKEPYAADENGGISGIVFYAVTRAEDYPELAAAEPWEPGIPNVTVNLYDSTGTTLLATTETDSWDADRPSGCKYGSGSDRPYIFRGEPVDCFDGMRNWNQVRPGVFDGGYAFGPEFDIADFEGTFPAWIQASVADPTVGYMVPDQYVVEVVPPANYDVIRSEDRNVDFGYEYGPSTQALPPACVGTPYTVPAELSLFPGEAAPLAGDSLPDCDRKLVQLSGMSNAPADFFLYTEVPIAAHIVGFILDDTANEFDPASPQFGEKYAPPFLPVSIRDFTGQEIARTVSDEFGRYNSLVPSTFTQNLGKPSGISPNMLTSCMNAKTKVDGSIDPLHNPQYSQFCYTFQFMPGSTTYLDTPVVPVAAFAGADQFPLDCEFPAGTPRIKKVNVKTNGVGGGPYIPGNKNGIVAGTHEITIQSMGAVDVPNPAYDGAGGTQPKTISRNYKFGNGQGTVTLGGVPLAITSWTTQTIVASVPDGTDFTIAGGKQLVVTRSNGTATETGISVQVGLRNGSSVVAVPNGGSIQDAIDAAGVNDLILVPPGTYNEMVIMWKPVQLQGWGAGSTFIDAIKTPFEKLVAWRAHAESLLTAENIGLIPGQNLGFGGIEPDTFFSEEGAGVFIVAPTVSTAPNYFNTAKNRGARVDGFTISGADTGGGVIVNGFGQFVDISNLKITNNSGFYAGGIRIGHPFVTNNGKPSNARNNNVNIHHNEVIKNGGLDGAGGGIALFTGSHNYKVTDNFVCGNFTTADGAGIAHYGLNKTTAFNGSVPLIADNTILFNENFNQGMPTNGGGILIAGKPAAEGDSVTEGSGSVIIARNRIQGNSAGAGDGGGIQLSRVNGADVVVGAEITTEYSVEIVNNIIVNNTAALSGAGISVQDALDVLIHSNTIAHNDNASTAAGAFSPGIPTESNPQPGAGVVTRAHLDLVLPPPDPGYSVPTLENNIIYQNRMFYWLIDDTDPLNIVTGLCPDLGGVGLPCGTTEVFDDLAVIGTATPQTLLCTAGCVETGDPDPMFVAGGFNGNSETTTFLPEVKTSIQAPPALDEGGNFIRLRYGPLTQVYDFHIEAGSSAIDAATNTNMLIDDIDRDPRPGGTMDSGADELVQP